MKQILYLVLVLLVFYSRPSLAESSFTRDICKVIQFGISNGSVISKDDLMHCHILATQDSPNIVQDLVDVGSIYRGLLCHAHEFDEKRQFDRGGDNVNILLPVGGSPFFLGVFKTAYAEDLKKSFPLLKPVPKISLQVKFFPINDFQCSVSLRSSSVQLGNTV